MFNASLYYPIYLFIVTILTFYATQMYNQRNLSDLNRTKTSKQIYALLVCLFMLLFIGLRPISGKYFLDMANYNTNYEVLFGERFWFDREAENFFFDNWFAWMASEMIDITYVFLIFAAIYFSLMFVACRKLFPKDTFLAFMVYLAAFSTFSYGTNGMKAGMAASTFLVALAYYDKLWISIPLSLFTMGQHHSMALVIASYFLVLVVKNPKYYFGGWVVCVIMAALHISFFQFLFAGFADERGSEYLLGGLHSGFRLDFIIYSAVPVAIGYLMIFEYGLLKSRTYNIILNLYLTTNSFWMLCMYANYSNRIAYLSWFLYPIVLLYPFVNIIWYEQQIRYLRYVVYGHLAFTLFMTFIYYR